MARKFSHPEIQALAVGDCAIVFDVEAEVLVRRVDGYAKRSGRTYGYMLGEYGSGHTVTRLPDPEPQP